MTRLYGVIGDPIAHSLSPLIHRGWIRDARLDADYQAFHVPDGLLAEGLQGFARRGVHGLNVTMPHKGAVLEHCDSLSPLAERLGAVNTLVRRREGGWHGENTDHGGFLDDFTSAAGAIAGRPVLLLGAGGAAQAVADALNGAGVRLVIANRTLSKAEALAARLGLPDGSAIGLDQIEGPSADADVLVNCLSIGHGGATLQLGPGRGRLLYDISYGEAVRPLFEEAQAHGWHTVDGLGMLIAQAARAFAIWHDIAPDREAALGRCRTALGMAS